MSQCHQKQYKLRLPSSPCDSPWYLVFLNIQVSPLRLRVDIWVVFVAVIQWLSRVWLSATPWTIACQAPLSMGFPRQEYWRGVAVSFCRGSSWLEDQTHISCIGRQILYHWATFGYQELIPGSQWPCFCHNAHKKTEWQIGNDSTED